VTHVRRPLLTAHNKPLRVYPKDPTGTTVDHHIPDQHCRMREIVRVVPTDITTHESVPAPCALAGSAALASRQVAGGIPTARRNALLKAASDS